MICVVSDWRRVKTSSERRLAKGFVRLALFSSGKLAVLVIFTVIFLAALPWKLNFLPLVLVGWARNGGKKTQF